MKQKLFLLASAVIMMTSVTFAKESKAIPENVVKEFNTSFDDATNAQWTNTGNYYKAIFTEDGQNMTAFYNYDGTLAATSRKISIEQLPMVLVKDVKKMSANYSIADLFELRTDRGTEYYISYKNDKETKTFYSAGESWAIYDSVNL